MKYELHLHGTMEQIRGQIVRMADHIRIAGAKIDQSHLPVVELTIKEKTALLTAILRATDGEIIEIST